MATLDTSTIASIGDNTIRPVDDIAKAQSIGELIDRSQLSKLELGERKREVEQSRQVEDILKRSDYSTPQGLASTAAAVQKVSPKAAMGLLKEGQQYQAGQNQNLLDQYTLIEQRHGLMVQAVDPIIAQARAMKQGGASDLAVRAYITQQMPGAVEQLRQTKLSDGQPALPDNMLEMLSKAKYDLPTLESWEGGLKQGAALIKQRIEQAKLDLAGRAQTTKEGAETEKERHDRATEASAARRDDIAAAKAKGFDDRESELLAAFADKNVNLPVGLRSQQQIKSTIDGLFARHPDMTADQIAEGIKSGKLKFTAESKAAATAGTQIGRVALAANELDTFGDQVLTASKDVPRGVFGAGKNLTINGLIQAGERQFSNPQLLRLRAKLQALNNAYDQLAARGGGTDAEKRAHIHELFDARLSDESVKTLVQAMKEEAVGARQAAERTVGEVSDTANIPGTGPAGGAGAARAAPPVPGATNAPPAGPLQKGQKYQHASGATVEIID